MFARALGMPVVAGAASRPILERWAQQCQLNVGAEGNGDTACDKPPRSLTIKIGAWGTVKLVTSTHKRETPYQTNSQKSKPSQVPLTHLAANSEHKLQTLVCLFSSVSPKFWLSLGSCFHLVCI